MRTKDDIHQDFEKRKNEYILDFIRKRDLISSDGNIILSQKIFVINSVLRWCLDSAAKNKMSQAKWAKFNKILSQYIAGIVELRWKDDGALEIIEIPTNDKKRRNTRTRTKTK